MNALLFIALIIWVASLVIIVILDKAGWVNSDKFDSFIYGSGILVIVFATVVVVIRLIPFI